MTKFSKEERMIEVVEHWAPNFMPNFIENVFKLSEDVQKIEAQAMEKMEELRQELAEDRQIILN